MGFSPSQGTASPSAAENFGHKNKLVVSIDFSSATWNTVATHEVFTVTGLVRYTVIYRVTESLTSGGSATVSFGDAGSTTRYCTAKGYATLTAGVIVKRGADAASTQMLSADIILPATFGSDDIDEGVDLGYEVGTAALTNGTIEAYCYWTPISEGATVTAGPGSAL